MKLFDYSASANCYKVRLALAQLNAEYERVPVDIFAGDTLTVEFRALNAAGIDMRPHRHIARWLQTVRDQPGHIDGLAPYPANARRGAGRSIYD